MDALLAALQWVRQPRLSAVRFAALFVVIPVAIKLTCSNVVPAGVYGNGVVIGALYGLIAMGLVLVYRGARVINFAQANLGSVPAVLGLTLFARRNWPYWACVLVLLAGAPITGAVVERVVVRPFAKAPRLILAVVLIGAAQFLAGIEAFTPKWVSGEIQPPQNFKTPLGSHKWQLGGFYFTGDHLFAVVVVVVLVVALAAFFRFTSIGIAVRASADNGERAALVGIPTARVSSVVWILAAVLSGAGVFLRGPLIGLPLGGQIGPVILLYALAAAVIARMESLPVALVAGMLLGMLDQGVYYGTGFNPNVATALILPILLGALVVQRRSIARAQDAGIATWQAAREFRRIPNELRNVREVVLGRRLTWVAAGACALAAPFVVDPLDRNKLTLVVIYAIVGVSLVILTGWAGQISLGQFAFAGVGAAVAGGLAADAHWDFFVCVAVAGLAGAAIAVVLGLPALRIQGLFLAVTTLAFATNMQSFFLNRQYFSWVLPEASNRIERPVLWDRIDVGSDLAFYFVCVGGLLVAVLVARSMRSSRSGRVLIATRDNPRAAQSYGIGLARTRLAAFAIAGFLAAVAGALLAFRSQAVDPGVFQPQESLSVFAMAVIGGLTSVAGGVVGAVYVVGCNQLLSGPQALLATGIGVIVILRFFPGGLVEAGYRVRDVFLRRVAARHAIHVPSLVADSLTEPLPAVGEPSITGAAQHVEETVEPLALSISDTGTEQ